MHQMSNTPQGRERCSVRQRDELSLQQSFSGDLAVVEADLQGRITFANEVFQHASGFTEAELLGQSDSLTRHPDMPGSIAGQLWQKVRAGEELFFFVQNRAKSGSTYWDLAHVTPRFDARGAVSGYRAVCRPADAEEVAQIEPFYRKIRKLERGGAVSGAS